MLVDTVRKKSPIAIATPIPTLDSGSPLAFACSFLFAKFMIACRQYYIFALGEK